MSEPDIGAALRDFRKSLGLSQEAFSKQLSSLPHMQQITKIEHGHRRLAAVELAQISVVFGVSMDEIVFGRPGVTDDRAELLRLRSLVATLYELIATATA